MLRELADAVEITAPASVSAASSIEMGLSPRGGAEALVLRVIDSAKTDIKAPSCSLVSPRVVAVPLRVAKRGVAVSLVANYKNNVTDDRSGKGRAALPALAGASCDARVISAYPIYHGKVLIMDRQTVRLGSFNHSDAVAHANSENVLVNWNNPALARTYPAHFGRNW